MSRSHSICAERDMHAAGLACFYAHGREELRVEAAALLGNVPHYHRFQLCENWYRKGTCRAGDNCDFAHGLDEVR